MVVDQEPVVPSPQMVGREFVRQYYTMMGDSPQLVYRFYSNESVYVFNTNEPAIGQLGISERIEMLKLRDCHTKIRALDSYETLGRAVVVQVIGDLSINAGVSRRFAQTFVLAPQSEKKYYVHNNIFRYLDELFDNDTEISNMQSSVDMLPAVNGSAHEDELNNAHLQMPMYTINMGQQQQPLPPRSSADNLNVTNRFPTDSMMQMNSSIQAPDQATMDWANVKSMTPNNMVMSPPPHPPTAPLSQTAQQQNPTAMNSSAFYAPQSPAYQQQHAPGPQSMQAPLPPRSVPIVDDVRHQQQQCNVGVDQISGATSVQITSAPQNVSTSISMLDSPPEELRRSSSSTTIVKVVDHVITAATVTSDEQDDGAASTSPEENVVSSWANRVAGKKQSGTPSKMTTRPAMPMPNGQNWSNNTQQNQPQMQSQVQIEGGQQQASRESPAPSSSGMPNGGGGKYFGGGGGNNQQNRGRGYSVNKELSSPNLFVSNLLEDVTDEELRECFSGFGLVNSIEIHPRPSALPHRPFPSFAFVTFEDTTTAGKVMDGRTTLTIRVNHPVYVSWKREERNPRSIDRNGGGGGSSDRNYGGSSGAPLPRGGGNRNQGNRGNGGDPRGPFRGGGHRVAGGNAPRTFTQSNRGGGGGGSGGAYYYNAPPQYLNSTATAPKLT